MAIYHKLEHHKDKTPKHKITEEEREFLRTLQRELNTQDTVGQADPRFWVIEGTERIYGVEEAEGYCIHDKDDPGFLLDREKEVYEYIKEEVLLDLNEEIGEGFEFSITLEDGIKIQNVNEEYSGLDEIVEFLNEYTGGNYEVIGYKTVDKIYENTMFLTQKDAENHLRLNHYHYSDDAHTYAMTAWRSPEVEKLIKILREVEW